MLSQPGMSIVSYLSLCLSPLGVVHVGTAAYRSCLERGWGGRKQDDSKKAWASSCMFPMTKAIRARSFSYCTVCFLSLCTVVYIYIACLTEYEECQAFCLFVWEGRHTRLRGMGDPIPTKGQTLWYSMYTIIPLGLANTAFVNFLCVSLEIYGIPYMKKSRNSVKFREISRNYTSRNSAEFRQNCSQFRTEYGIDGSKKKRRNSVSAEFRGHPREEGQSLETSILR